MTELQITFQNKKITCFNEIYIFNKGLPYLLYRKANPCKDIVKPYYIKVVQKQPFADVLQNRCSGKFCKIHRKTPLLESLFNKVTDLKRVYHKCFPMIFANFSRTLYNKTPYTIKISYG